MVLTLLGAASAGLMTMPTSAQLGAAATTHQMPRAGAHTVGAPDGGAGLPGTGWSRDHGDLRIPLLRSACLAVPAACRTRRTPASESEDAVRLVRVGAISYAALFGIPLLVQALRGEALIAPSGFTTTLALLWAASTALAVIAIRCARPASWSPRLRPVRTGTSARVTNHGTVITLLDREHDGAAHGIALVVGQRRPWVTDRVVPLVAGLLAAGYAIPSIVTHFWSAPAASRRWLRSPRSSAVIGCCWRVGCTISRSTCSWADGKPSTLAHAVCRRGLLHRVWH